MTSSQRDRLAGASRRDVAITVLRVLASTALLVALYAIVPLQGSTGATLATRLGAGLVAVAVLFGLQLKAIINSARPALRAVEGLATSIPLVLVVFASAYLVMSASDPAAFNEPLSKVSALYFTITMFATVGFGDITPVSEAARVVVSFQMLLNLVVVGLGIRIAMGAVRVGRERHRSPDAAPGAARGS